MSRERVNSILVTFHNNIGHDEIRDYFNSFGREVSNVHEIPRLMLKRFIADVPESKLNSFVETFKSSDLVLSAYSANTVIKTRNQPSRLEKLNK
jgi:hypothetical protein